MTDEKKLSSNSDFEAASSSLRNSNANLSVQVINSLEIEGKSNNLLESSSDRAIASPDTVEVYGYLRLLPIKGAESTEVFKRSSLDFGFPGKLHNLATKTPTLQNVKKKAEVRKSSVSQNNKNELKNEKKDGSVLSTFEGVETTKSVIIPKPRTVKLVNQPESNQKVLVKKADFTDLNLKKFELKSRLLKAPENKAKVIGYKVTTENDKIQIPKKKALFNSKKAITGKKEHVPKVIAYKQSITKPLSSSSTAKTASKLTPAVKKDSKLLLKRQSIKMVAPVISENIFRKDSSSSAIANIFTTLSRSLSGLLDSEFLTQNRRQDSSLTRHETKSILSEPNNFYLKSKSRHLLSSSDAELSSTHELLSETPQLPEASQKQTPEKQSSKKSFISKLGKSIKSSSYQSFNNLSASFLKSQSSASLVSKASENAESKQSKSSINTVLRTTWKSLSKVSSKPTKVTSKLASKLSATFLDSGSSKKSKVLSSSISYDSKLSEAFLNHKSVSELDLTKSAANQSSPLTVVAESIESKLEFTNSQDFSDRTSDYIKLLPRNESYTQQNSSISNLTRKETTDNKILPSQRPNENRYMRKTSDEEYSKRSTSKETTGCNLKAPNEKSRVSRPKTLGGTEFKPPSEAVSKSSSESILQVHRGTLLEDSSSLRPDDGEFEEELSSKSVLELSCVNLKDSKSNSDIEHADLKASSSKSNNSVTEPLKDPVSVSGELLTGLTREIVMERPNELFKEQTEPSILTSSKEFIIEFKDNAEPSPSALLKSVNSSFLELPRDTLLEPGSESVLESVSGIIIERSSDPSVESSSVSASNNTKLKSFLHGDFSSSESNSKLQDYSILNSLSASMSKFSSSSDSFAELDLTGPGASLSKLESDSTLEKSVQRLSNDSALEQQKTPKRLNKVASSKEPKASHPPVKPKSNNNFVKNKPFCNYDNSHLNSVDLEEIRKLEVISREASISESSDFEALAIRCFRSSLREKGDDIDSIQVEEIVEPIEDVLFETKPWIEMINTDKDHVTNEWKYFSRPLESGLRVSDNKGFWNKHIPEWSPEKGVLIKLPLQLNSIASVDEESDTAEVERVPIQQEAENSSESFTITLMQDSKPTLKTLQLKPVAHPKQPKKGKVPVIKAAVQQNEKTVPVPKPGSQFLKKLKSTLNSKPLSPTKATPVSRNSLLSEPVLKIGKAEVEKNQPKRSATLLKASKKVELLPKNIKNENVEVVDPKPKRIAAKSRSVTDVAKRPEANEKKASLKLPFAKVRESTPSKSLLKLPKDAKQSSVSKERSVGSKDSRLRTFSELNKIVPKGLRKKTPLKQPANSKEKMKSTPVLQSELSKLTRQKSLDSSARQKSLDSSARQKSLDSLARQKSLDSLARQKSLDSSARQKSLDSSTRRKSLENSTQKKNLNNSARQKSLDGLARQRSSTPQKNPNILSKQESMIKRQISKVEELSRQTSMNQILSLSRQASFNKPLKTESRQTSLNLPQRSKSRDSSNKENEKENSVFNEVHKLLSSHSHLHSSSHSKSLTQDPTELSCSEHLLQSFRDSAAQMFSQSSHNTKKTHSSIWSKTEKSEAKEDTILKDESADEFLKTSGIKENRLFCSSPSSRTEPTDIQAIIKKFNVQSMNREELLEFIDYLAKNSTYKPVKIQDKSVNKKSKILRPSLNLQRVLDPDFNENVFCFVTDKDGYLKKVLRSVYPENRKPPSRTKIYEGSLHFDTPYRKNESTLASTASTPPSSMYACDIFHCCSTSTKKKDERTRKRNKSRKESRVYNQLAYVTKGPLHVTGHPQIKYSECVSNYPSSYNSEKKTTAQESAKWRVARSPVYGKSMNLKL